MRQERYNRRTAQIIDGNGMNFRSDNEAPAHPAILQALEQANSGFAAAYAEDAWTTRLQARVQDVFETDCQVLPISTGTAANSIALAEAVPPWGSILCHALAHIQNDEGGAPEFYTHGAKLTPLDGPQGKLQAATLAAAIDGAGAHGVHNAVPAMVSLTQATECGTVYRPAELQALSEVAHERGLSVHMDGARFANAIASLGCTPAELTWRAGVDVLSLGLTKNGALNAEAVIVFGRPGWIEGLRRRRKRGGHLLSKMRYVSAQLLAMLDGGLWLQLAAQANARAAELAAAIEACKAASLHWPVEANEVFMRADPKVLADLQAQGFEFYLWPGQDDLARLVCSFATAPAQIEALASTLNRHSAH